MSIPAGWYPDPGGRRGEYRYWDGASWSSALSSSPSTPPPTGDRKPARRSTGLWIAIVVGLLVVALVGYGVFRLARLGGLADTPTAAGNPTTNPCPKNTQSLTPVEHTADGRVHGGMLSFPRLPSPWGPPEGDSRVPFGRDVQQQFVDVETNYNGKGGRWGAQVLVAELAAGDGFFTPQEGSAIVVKCLLGSFYGDALVTPTTLVDKSTTLGGKDAWLVEVHMTFDIPGLQAKGETAIVLIVATSPDVSSLFFATVPDNAPEYMVTARASLAALTVGN